MATPVNVHKRDNHKNSYLRKCFVAIVDRKQVNLDLEVLELILKHELQVNVESLDQTLNKILPVMLVSYMKNWPGWQKSKEYYSGKLDFRNWYEKFRQYIVVRVNFLIKNGYKQALEMIAMQKEKKSFQNHETQTDYLVPKVFTPFSVSVQCPAKIINSLVFTDSGDDVKLQQHTELGWAHLSLLELLNWPYIGVEFSSPELSFKRFNRGEYVRYVSLIGPVEPENTNFIEEVDIMDPAEERHAYTLNLLKTYTKQYLEVIRGVKGIRSKSIEHFAVVTGEFFKDIEEIGMNNTMASNTSVLFNIGRSMFFRSKKISKNFSFTGPKTEVGYYEKYIPKMETQLIFFRGIQDTSTATISFSYLNILKKALAVDNKNDYVKSSVPTLLFHCLFCDIRLNHSQMTKHLEEKHTMEPNFSCIQCNKALSVYFLAKARWKHDCKVNKHARASTSTK